MKNYLKIIFILTFVMIYIGPQRDMAGAISSLIYYLLLGIIAIMFMFNNYKLRYKDYWIFMCLAIWIFIRIIVVQDIEALNVLITLIIAHYIVSTKERINTSVINKVLLISMISCIIQMCIFRGSGRPVLNIIDNNYSGFYLFCLYMIFDKNKSKLKNIILVLGLLTFSRNFILAMIVYHIFNKTVFKKIVLKLKLNNFYVLSLSCIIALIMFSYYFVNNVTIEANPYSINRLFQFNDPSNLSRFKANIYFVEELFKGTRFILWGEKDILVYTQDIYRNIPHNAFLEPIRRYGLIMYCFMFYYIGYFYNKIGRNKNINILLSLTMYFLFLGAVTYGYKLILILLIYKISNQRNIDETI